MQNARSAHLVLGAMLLGCLLAAGCNLDSSVDLDGGDDRDGELDGSRSDVGDAGDDAEGGVVGGSGSATLVVSKLSISTDRVCDLNDDGLLDNAVADLGNPSAELVAGVVSTLLQGSIDRGSRSAMHFPWVDDLSFGGSHDFDLHWLGLALADDFLEDDFSGEETFYVDASDLNPCGEPARTATVLHVDAGEFRGPSEAFTISRRGPALVTREAQISGSIEPGGSAAELVVCGYFTVNDLGTACIDEEECGSGELPPSLLEIMVSGAAGFGIPGIPGITPDVDLDGDGLEQFETDGEGRLLRCVDGDDTVIEGRQCWQDERIADGFGLVVHGEAVRAVLVGREPGWEHRVEALLCEGGPPEESLLNVGVGEGSCVGLEEVCDPRLESPCCEPDHACMGYHELDFRCFAPCEPAPCPYGNQVGSCYSDGLCNPISSDPDDAGCTPDTDGCTTDYGVSGDTHCFVAYVDPICLERCSPTVSSCSDRDHACFPLPYGEGGACAFTLRAWRRAYESP